MFGSRIARIEGIGHTFSMLALGPSTHKRANRAAPNAGPTSPPVRKTRRRPGN